jgi:uncharacterized protein YlbG (UPF0298 family)
VKKDLRHLFCGIMYVNKAWNQLIMYVNKAWNQLIMYVNKAWNKLICALKTQIIKLVQPLDKIMGGGLGWMEEGR